jgi:uroporphyrinogen III methyltransferase/synthase
MGKPLNDPKRLQGCSILLTREHAQVAALSRMFEEQGAHTLECPTITFSPPDDWRPVDRCIGRLADYQGILFTSVNAVNFFFLRLEETGTPGDRISKIPCFAVGPATARALAARDVPVRAVPDRYQAEGLVAVLENEEVRGKRFLFPRARTARELLTRALEDRGAVVDLAVVYETRQAVENRQRLRSILAEETLDIITFTSTSTVRFFGDMAGPGHPDRPWKSLPAACIGEITAGTARDLGFRTVLTAPESTLDGLVRVVADHVTRRDLSAPAQA